MALLLACLAACSEARSVLQQGMPRRAARSGAFEVQQRSSLQQLRGGQMAGERGAPAEDGASGYIAEVDDERAALSDVERPRMAHELEVGDAVGAEADSAECAVHPEKMAALNLMAGDTVRLKGRRARETICVLRADKSVPAGGLWLTAQARGNLRVKPGDYVKLYACDSIQEGVRVTLQPFGDSMGGLSAEELQEQVMAPYFAPAGAEASFRPVHEGDRIRVRRGAQVVEMMVVTTEPERRVLVSGETEIEVLEEPIERADLAAEEDEGGYDDIGGVDKQVLITSVRKRNLIVG